MSLSKREALIESVRQQVRAVFARVESDNVLRMIENGLDEAAIDGMMTFQRNACARGEGEAISESIVVIDLLAAGCDGGSIEKYLAYRQQVREQEAARHARELGSWQRVGDDGQPTG